MSLHSNHLYANKPLYPQDPWRPDKFHLPNTKCRWDVSPVKTTHGLSHLMIYGLSHSERERLMGIYKTPSLVLGPSFDPAGDTTNNASLLLSQDLLERDEQITIRQVLHRRMEGSTDES